MRFEIVGEILDVEVIASGRGIRELARLRLLVAAARAGVLAAVAREEGATPDELAAALGVREDGREALREWLAVGEAIGELRADDGRLRAGSALARTLAGAEGDALLAVLEEMVGLHRRLLLESPTLLREGRRLTLADQEGPVIARSSRILEPLVREAVAAVVPTSGALRVLEVGCGSGTYVRFCVERNRELTVHGLELQPDVAEQARRNLRAWGVDARATIADGDVRGARFEEPFDLVTLHDNVYYFPEREQPAVLAHLRGLLRPGGRLLVTTACRGGSPAVAVLSLWGAITAGCAPMPVPDALSARLREAGFVDVEAWNLAAGLDAFWAFVGRRPG